MPVDYKRFPPHIVVILLFIIAALTYFNLVLKEKKIFRSDIVQYTSTARQQNDFRKAMGEETVSILVYSGFGLEARNLRNSL